MRTVSSVSAGKVNVRVGKGSRYGKRIKSNGNIIVLCMDRAVVIGDVFLKGKEVVG